MSRLKVLKKLYQNIGVSPRLIENYQTLYATQLGGNPTDEEIFKAFNQVHETKVKFSDLENIINYERQIITDFNNISSSISKVVDDNDIITIRGYNKLRKELLDAFEAIEKSFISIGDYNSYSRSKDILIEKMDSHLSVLQTEIELNSRKRKK
jgi:hypothetical protein